MYKRKEAWDFLPDASLLKVIPCSGKSLFPERGSDASMSGEAMLLRAVKRCFNELQNVQGQFVDDSARVFQQVIAACKPRHCLSRVRPGRPPARGQSLFWVRLEDTHKFPHIQQAEGTFFMNSYIINLELSNKMTIFAKSNNACP
jgi:hypothetical protein